MLCCWYLVRLSALAGGTISVAMFSGDSGVAETLDGEVDGGLSGSGMWRGLGGGSS